ncbi:MAG: thioredoxin-dependent thiol peroxidase [Candidatus Kapaibacterium sp.]|jgi:peroxiredoxin Q/BCP|nr:thioredoxin-dependent thiol peroxidase [Candidatus Kapabacteria bacterium]
MALTLGKSAPDFIFESNGESEISLNDYKGKWVILYFYPKDNTSGCTKEACEFRDNMERISAYDAVVLGVSPDNTASHDKFKAKHNLNFTLIADPEKEICNLYNVMGEKSMYGRKYVGVIRSTFIINPEGIIVKIFSKVKVNGHVDEVIKLLQEFRGSH